MLVRLLGPVAAVVAVGALTLTPPGAAATKPKPKAKPPKPVVLSYTVTDGRVTSGNKQPSVKQGKLVKIVVVANRGEAMHLHGYDLERTVRPGKQTVMQFTARLPGRFELELHHPDITIARLSVTP